MKKIFTEAHKMTREIKENYPEVNYQAQFGLCVSYLFENKKEEKEMKLKGTEKQVAWAKEIRKELLEEVEEYLKSHEDNFPGLVEYKEKARKAIMNVEHADTFIGVRVQGNRFRDLVSGEFGIYIETKSRAIQRQNKIYKKLHEEFGNTTKENLQKIRRI